MNFYSTVKYVLMFVLLLIIVAAAFLGADSESANVQPAVQPQSQSKFNF